MWSIESFDRVTFLWSLGLHFRKTSMICVLTWVQCRLYGFRPDFGANSGQLAFDLQGATTEFEKLFKSQLRWKAKKYFKLYESGIRNHSNQGQIREKFEELKDHNRIGS